MSGSSPDPRAFKDEAYAAFAQVVKALASPRRLELVDLLIQGPLSVDRLAHAAGQPIANTSQHLQVLRRANMVARTRGGTTITYALAPHVADVFVSLRRLATDRNPALSAAVRTFYADARAPEVISADELRARMALGQVHLIDLRPAHEYAEAHIPDARSLPIDQLHERLSDLPADQLIVATCRGPFCVYAATAVRVLRGAGKLAVRFEGGVADWAFDGHPLVDSTTG